MKRKSKDKTPFGLIASGLTVQAKTVLIRKTKKIPIGPRKKGDYSRKTKKKHNYMVLGHSDSV